MLPLSANPDFKNNTDAKIYNPYYDLSTNLSTEIENVGWETLDQAIENVLCTEKYERIFNLSFSSPVYNILFENATNISSIVDSIFQQIEYWVPITIFREYADIKFDDESNTLMFKIPYISNDGRISHTFSRKIGK